MADRNDTGKIRRPGISVDGASALRDFCATAAGWKPEEVSRSHFGDCGMTMPATGEATAGVCHARRATPIFRRNA